MTLPTIKGASWVLMRVGDPVGVQNYGRTTRDWAFEKARKYVAATPGEYELVRVEHIEREAERFPVKAEAILSELSNEETPERR